MMLPRGRCPLLVALALVLPALIATPWAPLAHAAGPYDPSLAYHTVGNRRFCVHYPPGGRNLALRVLRRAHGILVRDAVLLGNMPQGIIDIVLTDTQDDANGSAQVVPKNILRLYLAAPTELTGLAFYDDWLDILLTHELAHLVDIDQTRGFTRFLRDIFGRTIAYNGSTPQFLSEGVAVYAETKNTSTGRGRSSYVEMLLRMAALEDAFPHLDQAHILYAEFPFGNAAYFFGGRFHLYLSERFGENAVAKLHTYFASQLVPLIYGPGSAAVLGTSLPELWRQFGQAERAYGLEVLARVQATGITPSRQLTHHGRDLSGARFSPDGAHIVYSRRSPYDGPTVRWLDVATGAERRLLLDTFSHRIAFDPGAHAFVYSQAAITHRFDNFGDLYAFDLRRRRRHLLRDAAHPHDSLRARDPIFSPDGQRILFVQTAMQQSWLTAARVVRDDAGLPTGLADLRQLLPPSGEMQMASPAFSPDGNQVALSVWLPGGLRDIHLIDAHTGALVRRLTRDQAQDGNPCFSPDGRYVLYESDADGISNIYAFDTVSSRYARVTNVVGGAFQPDIAADSRRILFRSASATGFDLHEMPFEPASWAPLTYDIEAGYLPVPIGHEPQRDAGAPSHAEIEPAQAWHEEPLPSPLPRQDEPPLALAANDEEREGPYSPWRTLLPNRDNWLVIPGLYFINNDLAVSLATFGQDVLAHHTWALQAGVSQHGATPNVALSYANDLWLPTLSLSLDQSATPYATRVGYAVEVDASLRAGIAWPWARRHQATLSYGFEHRRGNQLAQSLLPLGRVAALQAGYSYSFARNFNYAISPEHGRALSINALWYSPHLGSTHEELLLSGSVRGYINNPLLNNHVLALRATLNYALGPDRVQTFFLYGTQGTSLLTVQSSRLFGLRGFSPNVGPYGAPASGTGLLAGYAEYRLPLWHIQRGIGTWPIYFEHLHLALFADAGNTFGALQSANRQIVRRDLAWALQHLWLGTGAEVRLDVAFAWNYGMTLRVGVAQGALAAGQRVIDSATPLVYFDVGTTL